MATGGGSKQKGFYIRDLLQTSSGAEDSKGSVASPAEFEKQPDSDDDKSARGRSQEGRREDAVTVCRPSRSADGQTRVQRVGTDCAASTLVSRDAAGIITGNGRTLIRETVALGFGSSLNCSVIKPLPALPGVMIGAPFGLHGLPDIYRDPRLSFRIATNAVKSICRCDTQECDGNPYQHDSGYRTYKGLYNSDQLFDAKDTHPVPVPFYVRMRPDALSCDGCFKAKKCRRSRTVFTELQLMGLEKRFESQKYLSTPDRVDLAEKLGLTQIQVKTWYQNRRMKWKKQVLQSGGKEAPTKPKGRPRKAPIEGDANASGKTNDVECNHI